MSRRARTTRFLLTLSIVSAGFLHGAAAQGAPAAPPCSERSPESASTVGDGACAHSSDRTTDDDGVNSTGRKIG